MIKVTKFGGSSLASDEQFKKVAKIVLADKTRRYVVPSAPGKRHKDDIKITDMLYTCYEETVRSGEISPLFETIKERYNSIIAGLNLNLSLEKEFDTIKRSFLARVGKDYAASRGEYLNGIIMANFLGFDFIDAAEVIFFNNDGTYDAEKTNQVLGERLKESEYAVIPGFYGVMPNDTIKTFSRGGSDITGAIVARAAGADEYENWTDVSGFMIADPRIIDNPKNISVITYRELRELSYMGATVLHEDAIFPVKKAGIPIHIKNTNAPEDEGTLIVTHTDRANDVSVLTGIAGKKGFTVLTLEKDMMNEEKGFGRKLLQVLEKNDMSFEHLPSGIDTMSVVVNEHELEGKEDLIISELIAATSPDSISIEKNIALIAVVGRGMKNAKGTAASVFMALADNDINIRMIDQGSSELNIIVGVDNADFEKSIRTIYSKFVN
ncbi:MAG: aspartate kinase [Clostridiales bacterium]|nr:MAG: aspartate kinase [Clostridiales bacterium]